MSYVSRRIAEVSAALGAPPRVCALGLGKSTRELIGSIDGGISALGLFKDGEITEDERAFMLSAAKTIGCPARLPMEDAELYLASPSVRRERLFLPSRAKVTSDAELFFDYYKGKVFAVSGSEGKSTVTTLISLLLGENCPAVGNVGSPFCLHTDAIEVAAELSSFMLRYMKPHSHRAALTNVSENHLNWHEDMDEYLECKLGLLENTDGAVLCLDDPILSAVAENADPFAVYSIEKSHDELRRYGCATVTLEGGFITISGRRWVSTLGFARRERHYLQNMLCAVAMTLGYCSDVDVIRVGESFRGLAHRGQRLTIGGIDYVDSSIDTTPSRMAATLSSFGGRVRLLLGGRSKGAAIDGYSELIKARCTAVAAYGEAAAEFSSALLKSGIDCRVFAELDDALVYLEDGAEVGDVILLSPGATSYDRYSSFEERGDHFLALASKKHL